MTVQVTIDGGVAQVLLDRPEKRNAMNPEMLRGLVAALQEVRASSATALVLGAVGPTFCVGADLDVVDGDIGGAGSGDASPTDVMLTAVETYLRTVRALPMPVVVAVEGAAAGGGAALALSGDLRVLGRSAKLYGSTFPLGMTPDAGMSWFLARALGSARAVNLMMRNTPLDATFLHGVGLADEVVDDGDALAQAHRLAAEIGPRTPPLALVGLRTLMESASTSTLDQQLAQEAHWVRTLNGTEDFEEGVSAFLQRRSPVFRGR